MKKENIILIAIALLATILIIVTFFTNEERNNPTIKEISLKEANKMIEEDETFLLYVARTGCPSCEEFEPIFKSALKSSEAKTYKIDMAHEDATEATLFYNKYLIQGTPTVLTFKNGDEGLLYNRLNGNNYTKEEIIKFIERNK